ncbi:MAG: GIY-YIG nuclease family protein [Candidatus Omnitrophota bacterium]|nr:GIY-YIG nuclease family protein [Candidatus Omnitrophota bacterium]
MLECQDKTLYVGVTLDILKRLKEHNTTSICKYTRIRKPLKLMYQEECLDHHVARCRESEIKNLSREKKLELIEKSLSVG